MRFAIQTSRDERSQGKPIPYNLPVQWQDQPTRSRKGYWCIEIEDLNALMALSQKTASPIIVTLKEQASVFDPVGVDILTIYDGYLE